MDLSKLLNQLCLPSVSNVDRFSLKIITWMLRVCGGHNRILQIWCLLWPWQMFRYALQWESKNIIAVSTAIQDWLTSSTWFCSWLLLFYVTITIIRSMYDVDVAPKCCRACIGVYEARCNVDCVKHTFNSIGMAGNATCRYWLYR